MITQNYGLQTRRMHQHNRRNRCEKTVEVIEMIKIKKRISKHMIVGGLLTIVIFVAALVVYKVDVTQYAVVTQFGNPVRE